MKTSWPAAANQRPLADAWRRLDVAQDRGGSGAGKVWESVLAPLP